jgi:hypothetical protein
VPGPSSSFWFADVPPADVSCILGVTERGALASSVSAQLQNSETSDGKVNGIHCALCFVEDGV